MTKPLNTVFTRSPLALLLLVPLLALMLLGSNARADELVASVDRTRIGINDTFTFTLRKSGRNLSDTPDFDPLRRDFDILSNQRSQPTRIINGEMQAWTEWRLTLAPKNSGQVTIPAFELGGALSGPIDMDIQERQQPASDQDQPMFIETEIDKDSVRVQEQILFTVRLYSQVNLDGAEIQPLELEDVVIKAVNENNYITQIDNRQHLVLETTFALFPQRSGTLEIPALAYEVAVSRGQRSPWGSRGSRQRLRADSQSIEVQPRPAEFEGDHWLPARDLRLTEHWSTDPGNLRQGEPVTRRITLEADGLTSAQLPTLSLPGTDGISAYPDRPQTDEQIDASGVTSSSTYTLAMVPNRSGRLQLPPVQLQWWDTEAQQLRTAEIPATELRVQAAPGASSQTSLPDRRIEPEVPAVDLGLASPEPAGWQAWHWWLLGACALLLALCLWLGAGYWRMKQELGAIYALSREDRHRARVALGQSWQAVKQAAKQQNLPELRQALLNWGKAYWPEQPPQGLNEIARRLGGEQLSSQLAELDAALYRGDSHTRPFDALALVKELNRWRVSHRHKDSQESALKPLYSSTNSQ